MKQLSAMLILVILFAGCKKDSAPTALNPAAYKILLNTDSVGIVNNDVQEAFVVAIQAAAFEQGSEKTGCSYYPSAIPAIAILVKDTFWLQDYYVNSNCTGTVGDFTLSMPNNSAYPFIADSVSIGFYLQSYGQYNASGGYFNSNTAVYVGLNERL